MFAVFRYMIRVSLPVLLMGSLLFPTAIHLFVTGHPVQKEVVEDLENGSTEETSEKGFANLQEYLPGEEHFDLPSIPGLMADKLLQTMENLPEPVYLAIPFPPPNQLA